MELIDFFCWIGVVALATAFSLGLANKWGIIEWLQVHSPNDFLNKLFSCHFCCSWWVSVVISLLLCIITGNWILMLVPFCSTPIAKSLV